MEAEDAAIWPDLSEARLDGMDLRRADLSEANLNEVNLTGAAARKTQDQERLPKARTAGAAVGRA
jgi:uncharacterized protein YjbI with pentapeptide repeats